MNGSKSGPEIEEVRELLKVLRYMFEKPLTAFKPDAAFPAEGALLIIKRCEDLLNPTVREITQIVETEVDLSPEPMDCRDILKSSTEKVDFSAGKGAHRIPLPL